jgi:hypothetical protein
MVRIYNPFKRVYYDKVKSWLTTRKIAVISAGVAIFWYLVVAGAIQPLSDRQDVVCTSDICESAEFTFLAVKDVYIYPNDTWLPDNIILKRTWGDSYRTINLSKTWNKNVKYAVKFSMGNVYTIKYWVYGKAPWEDIEFKLFENCPWILGYGEKEDYFRIVDKSDNKETRYIGLTEAWTEYVECNPGNETLSSEYKSNGVEFVSGGEFVNSVTTQYLTTETVKIKERVVGGYDYVVDYVCDNQTLECGDVITKVPFYSTVERSVVNDVWVDTIPETKPGECHNIRVSAELKPVVGDRNIEHVPEIYGEKFTEYDWWNSSWDRYPITNADNNTNPFLVNDTYGFDAGDGVQYIWCNASSPYIYVDTNRSVTQCADDSTAFNTIVDEGNGTGSGSIPDLIAFYGLSSLNDISGSGYSCTVVDGASMTDGNKIGKAYDFDGTDDGLNCSVMSELVNHDEFAVTMWVKPKQDSAAKRYLELYQDNGDRGLSIHQANDGSFNLQYFFGTSQTTGGAEGSIALSLNTWHFVAVTWNGSNVTAYVDTAQDWTVGRTGTFDTFTASNPHLMVGRYRGSGDFDANSTIDNVMVWNRSLALTEIIALYNNTNPDGYSSVGTGESHIYPETNLLLLNGTQADRYYEQGSIANITISGVGSICISINTTGYTNISCSTTDDGYIEYTFNTSGRGDEVNSSSTLNITHNETIADFGSGGFDYVRFNITGYDYVSPIVDFPKQGENYEIPNTDFLAPGDVMLDATSNETYFWLVNASGSDFDLLWYNVSLDLVYIEEAFPSLSLEGFTYHDGMFYSVNSTTTAADDYLMQIYLNGTVKDAVFVSNYTSTVPTDIDYYDGYLYVLSDGYMDKFYLNMTYTGKRITVPHAPHTPTYRAPCNYIEFYDGLMLCTYVLGNLENVYEFTGEELIPYDGAIIHAASVLDAPRSEIALDRFFSLAPATEEKVYHIALYQENLYPQNITIDSNNDGDIDMYYPGILRENTFYINMTDESKTHENLTYGKGGTQTISTTIPSNVTVTSAYLNLTGFGNYANWSVEYDFLGIEPSSEKYAFGRKSIDDRCDDVSGTGFSKYSLTNYQNIYYNVTSESVIYGKNPATSSDSSGECQAHFFEFFVPHDTSTMNTLVFRWHGYQASNDASRPAEFFVYNYTSGDWVSLGTDSTQSIREVSWSVDTNYIHNNQLLFMVGVDALSINIGDTLYVETYYTNIDFIMNVSAPTNVTIDTGFDGAVDDSMTGTLNETKFDLNITRIQQILDASLNLHETIKFAITTTTAGVIKYTNLNITYTISEVELTDTDGIVRFGNDSVGKLGLRDVNASVWRNVDYNVTSGNQSWTIFSRFTNMSFVKPYNWTDAILWFATSNSSTNLQPWSQTTNVSIYNVTVTGGTGSLFLSSTDLDSCVDLYVSDTSPTESLVLINSTPFMFKANFSTTRIWEVANLTNCGGRWSDFNLTFRRDCELCSWWSGWR